MSVEAPAPASPPPFYSRLTTLWADEHADWGLLPEADYAFASRANAVPLSVTEFAPAAAHFPIVFTPGANGYPVAVTGIVESRSLLTDAQGRWLSPYVPGYLRLHPFWLNFDAQGTPMLAVDESSPRVVKGRDPRAQPLFDADGNAGDAAKFGMEMCRQAHMQQQQTAAFMHALHQHNLLVVKQANFQLGDGSTYVLKDFQIIDEDAFRRLPDVVLGEWVRRGWADAVVVHLASSLAWQPLLDRYAERLKDELAALRHAPGEPSAAVIPKASPP